METHIEPAHHFGSLAHAWRHYSASKRSILDRSIDISLNFRVFFALAHTMLKALYAIRTIGVRGGSIPNSINGTLRILTFETALPRRNP